MATTALVTYEASPRLIAKYLAALKPIVANACDARNVWVRYLDELARRDLAAAHAEAVQYALSRGQQFQDARRALYRLGPPPGYEPMHEAIDGWLQGMRTTCEMVVRAGNSRTSAFCAPASPPARRCLGSLASELSGSQSPSRRETVQYEDLALTPTERARYAERLRVLELERLPEVLALIEAMQGSDDEDAYDDAVEDRAFMHAAIEQLRDALARAGRATEEEAARADYVRIGSRVLVRQGDGRERAYTIGLDLYDLDRETGCSFGAPIAAALWGKRAGDEVTVNAPIGSYKLIILSVTQRKPDATA